MWKRVDFYFLWKMHCNVLSGIILYFFFWLNILYIFSCWCFVNIIWMLFWIFTKKILVDTILVTSLMPYATNSFSMTRASHAGTDPCWVPWGPIAPIIFLITNIYNLKFRSKIYIFDHFFSLKNYKWFQKIQKSTNIPKKTKTKTFRL